MINDELLSRIKNKDLLRTESLVGGEWINADNGKTFDVINPSNDKVIATIANLSRIETKRAIDIAKQKQPDWAIIPAKQRANILKKLYDLIIENKDDLATIITAEMGKPLAESMGEVEYSSAFVEWFGEESKRLYGMNIPSPIADNRINVIRQPIGVVGAITPWNFPLAMIVRKLSPALASGCGIVCMPSHQTPLSALAMGVLCEQAVIPNGLISIITTDNADDIGKEFCENEIVRKISFTGSTVVGRLLMKQGAGQIKKLSLELGGNAPFIVFNDADIDDAIAGLMVAKFRNNGQTCISANRIYVQSEIHDKFIQKFKTAVGELTVGDGFEPDTKLGALINKQAVEKAQSHIKDAIDNGGQIILGGNIHARGGNYFEPTIIINGNDNMKIATQETFSPLAVIFKFETETDVIKQANNTIYGLASYVYSNDLSLVNRISESLEYGMVGINTGIISNEVAPFGGVKQSGIGREGSKFGMEDYTELKYICTKI